MNIQPDTDLTVFAGKRVVIGHSRTALITDIQHCADSIFPELRDGVGGNYLHDRHSSCQGGFSAFWWPYGTDLTLEAA